MKNPKEKLTNQQSNDLKKSIFTNYPDVKFNLLNIKSLEVFKENLQKIVQGIDVDAVVAANNISENDRVAIAIGSKYKAVSLKLYILILIVLFFIYDCKIAAISTGKNQ